MKKKTGIFVILLSVIVSIVMIFTALAGWGSTKRGSMQNIKLGLDLSGGVSITYEADQATPAIDDMDDTVYKLQRRVEEYSTEANVYKEGANRINVEIPGVTNADEILEDLGTPGSLYFIAEKDSNGNTSYHYDQTTGEYVLDYTIEELEAAGAIVCTGSDVADAQG
jgi:SecD/SecF fusion protein